MELLRKSSLSSKLERFVCSPFNVLPTRGRDWAQRWFRTTRALSPSYLRRPQEALSLSLALGGLRFLGRPARASCGGAVRPCPCPAGRRSALGPPPKIHRASADCPGNCRDLRRGGRRDHRFTGHVTAAWRLWKLQLSSKTNIYHQHANMPQANVLSIESTHIVLRYTVSISSC